MLKGDLREGDIITVAADEIIMAKEMIKREHDDVDGTKST